MHSAVYVQCALFSVQCAVCVVQGEVYSVQYEVSNVQYALYSVECSVCSVQCFCRMEREIGEGRLQQRPLSLEREGRSREASPDTGEDARAGKLEQLYSIRSQTKLLNQSLGSDILNADLFCAVKILVLKFCPRRSVKITLKFTYYM